jgi:hypothetical protein
MHYIYTPLDVYSKNTELKLIYDNYFLKIKEVKKKYDKK